MRRRFISRIAAAAFAALFLFANGAPTRAQGVDLALVLAVDCSGSVDASEFALQVEGYAQAFRHPSIVSSILSGAQRAIMVTYFQWGGPFGQHVAIPWTRIDSPEAAEQFATRIAGQRRQIFGGGTAVGGAIDFGRQLLDETGIGMGVGGGRRVIDISGDGIANNGRHPAVARDQAVAAGITINGLPILTDFPSLDDYFRTYVIGGPGAFVVPANDFPDFSQAVLNKLIREIAGRDDAADVLLAKEERR
jgi:hypothetical protein